MHRVPVVVAAGGVTRSAWMRGYAAEHGIDLAGPYGYADLPDLPPRGGRRPVAVRPDVPLYRHARRHRWTIEDWASSSSATRTPEPGRRSLVMLALQMFRRCRAPWPARRSAGGCPVLCSGLRGPLRLVTIDGPRVDRPGWARLRTRLSGICGSDLGALSGRTSLYFSAVDVAAVRARPRGRGPSC